MTILCEPNRVLAAALAPSLSGAVRIVGSLDEAVAGLGADPAERILVIGPDEPLSEVLTTSVALRDARPELSILLLRRELIADEVSSAVDAGVREVVPDQPGALATAVARVHHDAAVLVADPPQHAAAEPVPVPAAGTRRGEVVTVFAPKGGSGKTTISTNLAVALHAHGTRRVCLVDLDLEFGDVAISLRLEPVRSLVDAVTADVPDDGDAIALLTTEYQPGFDCILAPIEPGEAAKIAPQLVSDLLYLLRERYDYVVVDTPSQLSENVLAAVDAADELVLLANPEIPALKNLRLTLDTLDLLSYRRDARLILFNKQDDATGLLAAEVEEAIGMPLAARVPASRDVPASINKGVPIVAARPDHPVSVAITDFAQRYIVKAQVATKRRRGLFRRRAS